MAGTENGTRTAIVYCRTSTAAQREADTIEAQVERAKRIVEREGLRLLKYGPRKDGWLMDDGVSGSLLAGRGFAKLVDDLEAKRVKIDCLVVYSLSRIAREDKSSDMAKQVQSAQDWGRIKAVLRAAHVVVIDEDGENDPNNVLFDLKTTLAGEEYKLIRSRTMAGKARRMAEGKHAKGGRPPYGYHLVYANGVDRKNGWKAEAHPEDAKHLRKILGWFVEGGVTHAARTATQAGIPTPWAKYGKGSGAWTHVTIQSLVNQVSVYATGEQTLVYAGVAHAMTFPVLIDEKLYSAVEARKGLKTLKRKAILLPTGFIRCACGEHTQVGKSHGERYARCPKGCGSMREETFSAALWNVTLCRLVQIAQAKKTSANGKDGFASQLKDAKAQVQNVTDKISKVLDLYQDGLIDKGTLQGRIAPLNDLKAQALADVERIERERDAYTKKRVNEDTVEQRVQGVLRQLGRDQIKTVTLDTKRKLLGDLLGGERVVATWPKKGQRECSPYVTFALPPFGALPAVSVKSNEDVWQTMVGEPKGFMHLRYQVDDDVAEDVGLARR